MIPSEIANFVAPEGKQLRLCLLENVGIDFVSFLSTNMTIEVFAPDVVGVQPVFTVPNTLFSSAQFDQIHLSNITLRLDPVPVPGVDDQLHEPHL
jgi:hypothetical protein